MCAHKANLGTVLNWNAGFWCYGIFLASLPTIHWVHEDNRHINRSNVNLVKVLCLPCGSNAQQRQSAGKSVWSLAHSVFAFHWYNHTIPLCLHIPWWSQFYLYSQTLWVKNNNPVVISYNIGLKNYTYTQDHPWEKLGLLEGEGGTARFVHGLLNYQLPKAVWVP